MCGGVSLKNSYSKCLYMCPSITQARVSASFKINVNVTVTTAWHIIRDWHGHIIKNQTSVWWLIRQFWVVYLDTYTSLHHKSHSAMWVVTLFWTSVAVHSLQPSTKLSLLNLALVNRAALVPLLHIFLSHVKVWLELSRGVHSHQILLLYLMRMFCLRSRIHGGFTEFVFDK